MNTTSPRIAVLADDLIWSSRLVAAVQRAGAEPVRASTASELEAILAGASIAPLEVVVVDLNGRSYDAVEAVRSAVASGKTVISVGQHEDLELRRRALAAGAHRVYSYNKLFRDGPEVIAGLLHAVAEPRASEG
ncbi:MAG TPA: hypothetical protein VK992_02410 [Candidatus Caenarcaniphilales bacterium]|nr:hypothetical protein [Candidatus Caenarcaniphilales bacterium]